MTTTWYEWGGANLAIFRALNAQNFGEGYDRLMVLGTELGSHVHFVHYLCVIMIAMVWSLARSSDPIVVSKALVMRWMAVVAVLPIAYTIEGWWIHGLKDYFAFQRPYAVLAEGTFRSLGERLPPEDAVRAFPSGHSAFAMLMAAGLWPVLNTAGKWLAVVYVLWVGLSRIALGVHFPADVIGGFVLSYLTIVLVRLMVFAVAGIAARRARPVAQKTVYH